MRLYDDIEPEDLIKNGIIWAEPLGFVKPKKEKLKKEPAPKPITQPEIASMIKKEAYPKRKYMYGSVDLELCKYGGNKIAEQNCELCNDPLCSSCGYTVENIKMCNECYLEAVCQNCGELREPEYEHLGKPEYGHMEHVGYRLCKCNGAEL